MSDFRNSKHPKAAKILARALIPRDLVGIFLKIAIYTLYIHYSNFPKNRLKERATAKEPTKLTEAGFQYATTIAGIQLFKKRK